MPTNVTTQHADNARTGTYPEETLSWKNVNVNSFGKVGEYITDGFVWAQPLFVSKVKTKHHGTKDLVIAATARNNIYAFDANNPTGGVAATIWKYQTDPSVPTLSFGNNYGDVYRGTVGILGTPVIDLEASTLFAIAWTFDTNEFGSNPEGAYAHYLIAIDLTVGEERNKIKIEGEVAVGAGEGGYYFAGDGKREGDRTVKDSGFAAGSRAIGLPTSGDPPAWPITDTIRHRERNYVVFNPAMQLQRPGLLLHDGVIYSAFGARADQDPYHGWVFAHDARTLQRLGVFCTSLKGRRAGIWQAGEGISADSEGNIYVGTGNGDIFPAAGSYGDCLLKLRLENKGRDESELRLVGFSNAFEELNQEDEDFGASSPTMLSDRFMAGGGKDGHFYLFDHTRLDQRGDPASVKQLFIASYDARSRRKEKPEDREVNHHIHGSPVVYPTEQGQYLYIWGENDLLRCFPFEGREFPGQPNERGAFGTPRAIGDIVCSADGPPDSMHGGFLALSTNLQEGGRDTPSLRAAVPETGIVWISFPAFQNASQSAVEGELRAYKAEEFIQEISVDSKTALPTDDNHGRRQGRLVTLWSSRCNIDRDDAGLFPKFCCPMVAGGRVYLPSFQGTGKLLVYGLLEGKGKDGGYDIGFGGRTDLVFNGNAGVRSGKVRLTEKPHTGQAGSVFHKKKIRIAGFSTIFQVQTDFAGDLEKFRETPGFAFVIQDVSQHALGEAASGFGYSVDKDSSITRGRKIDRSIAVAFGLRNSVLSFHVNGERLVGGRDTERPAGINLRRAFTATIKIHREGVHIHLANPDAGLAFSHEWPLPSELGIEEGWVGFCGGSGLSGCTIDVVKWRIPGEDQAKVAEEPGTSSGPGNSPGRLRS